MDEYQMPKDCCPNCDRSVDGATKVSGEEGAPKPEDVTVCIYCAQILIFGKDLKLKKVSNSEFRTFPEETREVLAKAVHAIQFLRKQN